MIRVVATGTFDILHPGHLYYLEESRNLGDELSVIVARDANVKHKPRPILPEDQRLRMVRALKPVDRALLGDLHDMFRPIAELEPDIITLGFNQHFDEENLRQRLRERGLGADVVRISGYPGPLASSSKIVEHILKTRGPTLPPAERGDRGSSGRRFMRQTGVWGDDGVDDRATPLAISVPFLLCGVFLAAVGLFLPAEQWLLLVGMMVAYIVPPLGRETIIPLSILLGIPWWLIALTLAFLDFAGGLFMAWNFPLVLRVPYVGPRVRRFVTAGRAYLDRRPWLERLYFVGLIAFVSLPFDGSGSIVGSILGRMLGMTKTEVLSCITIGGIIGSFTIALGIDYIVNLVPAGAGTWVSVAVFLLIGTALLVMYRSLFARVGANT